MVQVCRSKTIVCGSTAARPHASALVRTGRQKPSFFSLRKKDQERHAVFYNTHRDEIHGIATASSQNDTPPPPEESLTAQEGDIVTIHWSCLNDQGEVIDSSKATGEPTTFEVGAGDIVGNQLFEAFDEAVRGLSPGETIGIKADGGPWQEELLFKVPRDHPEIQRMEGRYKNQGGVQEGLIAELSNGGLALVVECTDDVVTLDANSMMAGKTLLFELELLHIERASSL